jgi:hypothetical protein
MSSTLHLQQRLRRVVPAVVIVLGLLVISAAMIQQVAAQDGGTLKPPFKLNRHGSVSSFDRRGPQALPLNAPIIMSQTFDSTYNPIANLNQVGWHESYASGATSQYTWGHVATAPLTDTVWSMRHNPSGLPQLDPATGTYTNGMQALLIYGPLNLSDYTQLVMTGTYWLDTAAGDYFGMAYSTDGTNWEELYAHSTADPSLSQSHVFHASLNQVARKPVVWIALTFVSNDDNAVGRGAFVRDVVLRGNPAYKVFMPIIRLDPTPTPTATPAASYRYFYAFNDETSTNNPDFNRWGGYKETGCGTGCTYYQDLVKQPNGNPPPALTLYMQGTNGRGGAGPRQNGVSLSTATNFEYSADFYVYNGQLEARYGLVFDASSGTFPGSGTPPIDPYVNYYLLELHMDTGTRTKVAKWQIVKVENGTRVILVTSTNLPTAVNQGQWHNVKVRQQGTTISAYLNGTLLGSAAYDSSWGDARRRFGLYIDVRDNNGAGGGPFEYFADNIGVLDLP